MSGCRDQQLRRSSSHHNQSSQGSHPRSGIQCTKEGNAQSSYRRYQSLSKAILIRDGLASLKPRKGLGRKGKKADVVQALRMGSEGKETQESWRCMQIGSC